MAVSEVVVSFCVFLCLFGCILLGKIGKMKMNSIDPSYQVKQTAHWTAPLLSSHVIGT